MNIYDAKGKPCPEPVLIAKKALESETELFEVICGSQNSKENVSKFLTKAGAYFTMMAFGNDFRFRVTPLPMGEVDNIPVQCDIKKENKSIIFTADTIGKDEALGKILIKGFLTTLPKVSPLPQKIFFINSGVKITTIYNDEDILNALKTLLKEGVEIYSCGTCLDFYNLANELKIGQVGNVYDTLGGLLNSNSSIMLG
ncbi:MAG: hypothetical protein RL154_1604 [Pseudomonadota bacterium]|jgi:selenium metabolism protein YedF